jgi:uncharacterized protein YjbI with pentapeptide repeats
MTGIDLTGANLHGANLRGANLSNALLSQAYLGDAILIRANLNRAVLRRADLRRTVLRNANLYGADLSEAILYETLFSNVDLTGAIGLETCQHKGPSVIDHRTLQLSNPLPVRFLRGVGLPDELISYLPALFNHAIQHYSCFISYSTQDQEFAERLHADLQDKGVRCWFAPHDLPIGKEILGGIDEGIRLREKVRLILSEHSVRSVWVKREVTTALEEEERRRLTVFFPVRLDDAIFDNKEAWATQVRSRNIGDFRQWKDHDAYQRSFQRMLRDLEQPAAPTTTIPC